MRAAAFITGGTMQKENTTKKDNIFTRFIAKIKNIFLTIAHSSLATKLSCGFMGVGQIMRKQIVKGIIYALLEVLFLYL